MSTPTSTPGPEGPPRPPEAPPEHAPRPSTVQDTVCPRCGGPVGADQAWCLTCGAPARTRVVPTPRWRVPVIVVGAVVVIALGALAGAFVVGTRGGTEPVAPMTEPPSPGETAPAPPTAAAPPPTTAPPATVAPPASTPAPTGTGPVVTVTPSTPSPSTAATPAEPPAPTGAASPSGGAAPGADGEGR